MSRPHLSSRNDPPPRELERLAKLFGQQHLDQAEALSLTLTSQYPRHPFGWKVLGAVYQAQSRLDDSLAATQKAIRLQPGDAALHNNLGTSLLALDRLDEAEVSLRTALSIAPDYAKALNNLAGLLKLNKQLPEAERLCRRALEIEPGYAKAHFNLAKILEAKGEIPAAIANLRRAVDLNPDDMDSLICLCELLKQHDALSVAQSFYRKALDKTPTNPSLNNNYGSILKDEGKLAEAQLCFRKALESRPDWAFTHSNLLFCLSHDVMLDPSALFAEHLAFGELFEAPLRPSWQPHRNTKDPTRQLQIGIVSGDFCNHAIASFLEPVLRYLRDYNSLSLHAYYTHTAKDDVTERIRTYFANWHDVAYLNESELADHIRTDGIDILLDLSGHTAHNRLLTFARKPAPIQASWMGYPGTTGLQAMDYHFCDHFWIPPGKMDWQFTEKSAFLPVSAIFQPDQQAPDVHALPAQKNGYITFGSFNRTSKLNTSVIALWSILLRSIPNARMVLGSIPLDRQDALIASFSQEGILRDRLVFYPRLPMQDYLGLHHQVDICLDTFPYSGGTTIHHAAWMGVPTLTLAGDTPASRAGASEIHFWGLDEFIATSIEEFISKGLFWAANLNSLAEIRASMRARLAASPIGQPKLYADSIEATLRTMWQRWCNDLPPALIDVETGNSTG